MPFSKSTCSYDKFLCLYFPCAILIASSEKSIPNTFAPFLDIICAKCPVPHPTSITFLPFQETWLTTFFISKISPLFPLLVKIFSSPVAKILLLIFFNCLFFLI